MSTFTKKFELWNPVPVTETEANMDRDTKSIEVFCLELWEKLCKFEKERVGCPPPFSTLYGST
jgi:hypothetical protein